MKKQPKPSLAAANQFTPVSKKQIVTETPVRYLKMDDLSTPKQTIPKPKLNSEEIGKKEAKETKEVRVINRIRKETMEAKIKEGKEAKLEVASLSELKGILLRALEVVEILERREKGIDSEEEGTEGGRKEEGGEGKTIVKRNIENKPKIQNRQQTEAIENEHQQNKGGKEKENSGNRYRDIYKDFYGEKGDEKEVEKKFRAREGTKKVQNDGERRKEREIEIEREREIERRRRNENEVTLSSESKSTSFGSKGSSGNSSFRSSLMYSDNESILHEKINHLSRKLKHLERQIR